MALNIERMEEKGNVKGLIKALKNRDSDIRQAAARALCKVGDSRAVKPLISALKDTEWLVRRYAAEALGFIGDKRAVAPLTDALKDPYSKYGLTPVREAAAKALEQMRAAETATSPLDKLLARKWSKPISSKKTMKLIKILIRNCSSITEKSVSKCMDAIEKLKKYNKSIVAEVMCYVVLKANHSKVREAAVCVLKDKATDSITSILCEALQYEREESKPVRAAFLALKAIGDVNTKDSIVEFLKEFRETWRMENTITGTDMFSLGGHLDEEKSICLAACRALAELGGSDAVTAIKAVQSDGYWNNYDEIKMELPELIARAEKRS